MQLVYKDLVPVVFFFFWPYCVAYGLVLGILGGKRLVRNTGVVIVFT